jgi:acetolactate synthase small subunit
MKTEHTIAMTVNDVAGVLARVESIFRRQGAPIRRFSFEGETGGAAARLLVVVEADAERSSFLQKQLQRLYDVSGVCETSGVRPVVAEPADPFALEEKTA